METRIRKEKYNKRSLLFILVFLQIVLLLFISGRKQEYHIDEIFSYILSNSYDADKLTTAPWMWGNWVSESDFDEFVTVQPNERFSYKTVYYNNSTDCHPPLFYWILHTICSFFPNQFSKWFGLGMNIVLFALTELFVYLISSEAIQSEKLKFLPLLLYGFSLFAIDTCTFIRMYMLLTFLAMVFVYLHVCLFKHGYSGKKILYIAVVIYLGAMTQYYFLVLAFFGVLFYAVYLLKEKEIRKMMTYGISASFSVGAMYLSYPYVIVQATGSSTNNVGNEVAKNLWNFKLFGKKMCSLAYEVVCKISCHRYISFACAAAIVCYIIILYLQNKKTSPVQIINRPVLVWISAVTVFVFLTISFIGGKYVYLRYIYFIMPLFYVVAIMLFDSLSINKMTLQKTTVILCILFSVSNAVVFAAKDQASYLYRDLEKIERIFGEYYDNNIIVFAKKDKESAPTGNFTNFKKFQHVYMDTRENIEASAVFEDCINANGECVVYINTPGYWTSGYESEELLKDLTDGSDLKYKLITDDKFIADAGLGQYYYIY